MVSDSAISTILVDWAEMREGRELIALLASMAIKGHSIKLYEHFR